MSAEAIPSSAGDLSVDLLVKIMQRLRDSQSRLGTFTRTDDFADLVPAALDLGRGNRPEVLRNLYVDNHLEFLGERGYVTLGTPTLDMVRVVQLTAAGRIFVQPELAEFGREPILPKVVDALEDRIQELTYPQEEKAGMLFNLRDAVAKQAPDVVAKVLVEVAARVLAAGGRP